MLKIFIIFITIIQFASSWWLLSQVSNKDEAVTISDVNCASLPGLNRRQRELCQNYPTAVSIVISGLNKAVYECRNQFKEEQWNCTGDNGFGVAPYKIASRESAFVYAISSAAISHTLAKACSQGIIPNCGCGQLPMNTRQNTDFMWSGCSDNIRFGNSFGRKFMDNVEKQHMDARALMNLHNNKAARKLLASKMQKTCKCHGVSGSCVTKTCWKTVPKFDEFARFLKEKYERAQQVTTSPQNNELIVRSTHYTVVSSSPNEKIFSPINSIEHTLVRSGRFLKEEKYQQPRFAGNGELVFLDQSPDYCIFDSKNEIKGTSGRECTSKTCPKLCCGRGWTTVRELKQEPCHCKFIYCCEVKCQTCTRIVEKHYCR
uniref:Protein Wnt n=1 Tax=Strongyloides stercoralis TaxID=6248 RepID=A0A0K0EFR4_STRER